MLIRFCVFYVMYFIIFCLGGLVGGSVGEVFDAWKSARREDCNHEQRDAQFVQWEQQVFIDLRSGLDEVSDN